MVALGAFNEYETEKFVSHHDSRFNIFVLQ